ncbi:merozoite surface protein 7 (MSP7) [Plasmodium vivax Mauritania I]|uniref:Merozoite surface protein 7 (MSP7) n=1 Tax=Plasmodium vivax Mauritania I TaxID=1035515 RepID=A0A0J9T8C2_PLAVI|nr:merozoite surface protein 7 (MSP7) [Plasmodium vivax Mauritania I]
MRKKIVFVCSIFVLLSCSPASSEQLGIQKKKKNLEQDAMHALMKKLESLYKLSATDNGEIFNKEIDALKKQIDQLHQHGGGNEGESLGHLLESEAADDSGKKTIFGVDEDDLDNYDADFIGQSKGKIKGQADTTAVAKPPTGSGAGAHGSHSPPKPSVLVVPGKSGKEDSVATLENGYESIHGEDEPQVEPSLADRADAVPDGRSGENHSVLGESAEVPKGDSDSAQGSQPSSGTDGGATGTGGNQQSTLPHAAGHQERSSAEGDSQSPTARGSPEQPPASGHPQAPPARGDPQSPAAAGHQQPPTSPPANNEGTTVTQESALAATPPKGTADSNDAKIKYLDKLYDEVLTTSDNTNWIHVPDYHSKYNTIRQKYEYSMNPVEYEIVKNLFNVGFKNDGAASSDATPLVDVFKKALADEKFQAEFDNFVHGLYGFAKRHSYLSEARMKDNKLYSDLLKNAISLMNTLQVS